MRALTNPPTLTIALTWDDTTKTWQLETRLRAGRGVRANRIPVDSAEPITAVDVRMLEGCIARELESRLPYSQ